ncbi:hypothetical protein OIN60_02765 [Paenibacillus sp. P96]|uniref:ATP-grasp domain-containing protein n=1 Tax=Paenibacillus zeirhizosphaerae TaxID=2987519 RepID=A0ABT9FLY0_9BACL|nr:hypothetical protein [Paenibacillus sp. P96]MDP4095713.1 hypothetical protein [Paenibacillus sp. P96]
MESNVPALKRLYMGTFEAEAYWKDTEAAALPALPDRSGAAIVAAMDELLFCFCGQEDVLLTRYAMTSAHRQYISRFGFSPAVNKRDLCGGEPAAAAQASSASVFELLSRGREDGLSGLPGLEDCLLSPFAYLPYTEEAAKAWGIRLHQPSLETIRKVNAKTYSSMLKRHLGLSNPGLIVTSVADMEREGHKLLGEGTFLVKDDFGVSGKGNLHITSTHMLERIVSYLRQQEQQGKKICFILEPFLEKKQDFSCQFVISEAGEVEILSVQLLANSSFSYRESLLPDPAFIGRLEEKGYFELMKVVGRQLWTDGYFGDVCVDSMTLRDGSLEEIVEINARRSMSLIKHNIDVLLAKRSLRGSMTHYTLSHQGALPYEDLLHYLDHAGLLFTEDCEEGVMPLSANTLYVNTGGRDADDPISGTHGGARIQQKGKGRLYLAMIAENQDRKAQLTQRLEHFFVENQFSVLN